MPELEFIGKCLTLEEARMLPLEQKAEYYSRMQELNDKWAKKKARELGYEWMFIINGEIVAGGESIQSYPSVEETDAILQKYRKAIMVYIKPLSIEEEMDNGMPYIR